MRIRVASLIPALVLALAALWPAATAHGLVVQSQTFQMSGPDDKERFTVRCPGKKQLPYSGGMLTDALGLDGEGIYPHSFERLGVQGGWHVTPVLYDPSPLKPSTRSVTLQVICGPRLGPVESPHSTTFVPIGQSRTTVATCPKGNRIFAGGFQRTNFITEAGNYVTESRAISDRAWQVSGSAFGRFGGELTAIAYCLKSGGPLVSEVSGQSPLPLLKSGTATTTACPPGTSLIGGGFSTSPGGAALVSSAYLNPDGSWSTTAFNRFGPVATVNAYGYCMSAATIKRRKNMRHGVRGKQDQVIQAPAILDSALKVAIAERVARNGCFPGPSELVSILKQNKIDAEQANSPRQARRRGPVYVLSDSSCERVRFALRQRNRVVVLDSATGEVRQLFI